MAVFPAVALFVVMWLWQTAKDLDRGVLVMMTALPFGMFAAVTLGALSILTAHLLAVMTLGFYVLRRISGGLDRIQIPTAGLILLIFAIYALFSSVVLVRIFAGEFLVFPMSFDWKGLRLSSAYASSLKPLTPTSSNIAQSGYILISALVFIMLSDVCRRRGVALVETGMVWAATANCVLAVLDLIGADPVLALIRTADYTLLDAQQVSGLPRLIGGFAEASTFGAATAVFFGYFAMSYLIGRRPYEGFLALASMIFALMSLSSTGIAALAAAVVLIMMHAGSFLRRRVSRVFVHWMVIGTACVTLVLCVLAMTTPIFDDAAGVIDRLFFQKLASDSGLERSAWAAYGFHAFFETWWLGAGAGSLRANGLASVLLGSVGFPGFVLFVAFLWAAVGPSRLPPQSHGQRVFFSARVAVLTLVSASMVSATTPDPTLMLMAVASMAATLREGMAGTPVRPVLHAVPAGS